MMREWLLGHSSPLPSGNIFAVGDGFTNTSLVLVEHGYNATFREWVLRRMNVLKDLG